MSLLFKMFLTGGNGVTTLSLSGGDGGLIQQVDGGSPYDTTVGIRFLNDGTVEQGVSLDGAAISWTSAGTWIQNGVADSTYSVRFTNSVQDIGTGKFTTEAAVEDTFIDLSTTRTWLSNKTTSTQRRFHCTFEVRKTAGAPPATGSSVWTFDADNVV